MKKIKIFFLFLTLNIFAGLSVVNAQQKTAAEIKKSIASKSYVFTANVANPVSGGSRQLSAGYTLTVTNNNIISDLPYFGRAQTIPIGASDGGIKFTSTSFDYKVVPNSKNNGWLITILIKDVSHVQQLYLSVFDNGTANLDVLNIHRDNISFSGYVK